MQDDPGRAAVSKKADANVKPNYPRERNHGSETNNFKARILFINIYASIELGVYTCQVDT